MSGDVQGAAGSCFWMQQVPHVLRAAMSCTDWRQAYLAAQLALLTLTRQPVCTTHPATQQSNAIPFFCLGSCSAGIGWPCFFFYYIVAERISCWNVVQS